MGYGSYVINGKECGYMVDAVCEEPGCNAPINRGLSYACGGVPGEVDGFCDGYFCFDHLFMASGRHATCRPCRVENISEKFPEIT